MNSNQETPSDDEYEQLADFRHELDRLIRRVQKASVVSANEEENTKLLLSRLRTINGLSIAIDTKSKFLEYMQAELSQHELDHAEMEFVRTIDRITYAARFLADQFDRKVELHKDLREGRGKFSGPTIFDFIPFSILQNCIKYNVPGRTVTVRLDADNTYCYAYFESWGPRIEAWEMDRIFEKFYRGEHARKVSTLGRGLGLFHARQATESLYGGDLRVEVPKDPLEFSFNGVPYQRHRFVLKLPRSDR